MNKDMEKFNLFVYEKGNPENRKPIYYVGPDGKRNEKSSLALLDSATSSVTKQKLYNYLLKKGAISKEQTEFVIFYNEKKSGKSVIKQLPVIFDDNNIRLYSEYILGNQNEEHKTKFEKLNKSTFFDFVEVVDRDSDTYDKLSVEEQQKYMDGNSFSAVFSRLQFPLTTFKRRISDRIIGYYQVDIHSRTKENKRLRWANFNGIKNDIETSYRCFRDAYLYLRKDRTNLEENYKNIECDNYEELFKTKTNLEKIVEEKEKLQKVRKVLTEEKDVNIKYNVDDYLRLISNHETRNSFNDYVWESKVITKKVKDYTNRLANSMFDSDSEDAYSESVIRAFDSTHPGVIDKLIHEYYKLEKNKEKVIGK